MITNERQYKITRAAAARFKGGLDEFDEIAALKSGIDPLIVKAQRESLRSQYEELVEQLREYEDLRSGEVHEFRGSSVTAIGDSLVRARVARGLSQKELADRLGLKQQQIQRYEAESYQSANLRRLEEVATALQLETSYVFHNTTPSRDSVAPNLKSINVDVRKLPIREMKTRRWLDDVQVSDRENMPDELLAAAFLSQAVGHAPKMALLRQKVRTGAKVDMHALFAWQARVLQLARRWRMSAPPVSNGAHTHSWITELIQLSRYEDGPARAIEFLRKNGIITLIVPHLTQTHLDGAAMLLDGKVPVIALTLRNDRKDNFWFVLMHELGHIFLHRNRGLEYGFFDDEVELKGDQLELEADDFAQRALISDEAWSTSFARYTNSPQDVIAFAQKFRIDPSIVAGRIRRERNNYKIFTELVGNGEITSGLTNAGLVENANAATST
jgi:HTH-type transcriptional regulator/antitoxin HigA